MLQNSRENGTINIDCVDPLGRTALLMAIDNENLEMVEVLLENKVETKDALLHAINEEFVEAVEVLLDHEETIHQEGEPWVSFFFTIRHQSDCKSSFSQELGGDTLRHGHLHPRHHPPHPGGPHRQLRDHQDPAGPRRHPALPPRHQVRLRGLLRVSRRGQSPSLQTTY